MVWFESAFFCLSLLSLRHWLPLTHFACAPHCTIDMLRLPDTMISMRAINMLATRSFNYIEWMGAGRKKIMILIAIR